MNMPSKALLFGLAIALLGTLPVSAMPRTGRILVGKVQHVDLTTQSAVLVPEDESDPRPFTWVSRTVVFAGPHEACPLELREGMTIRIVRHIPFIGPPFATRMNLPASASNRISACPVCSAK